MKLLILNAAKENGAVDALREAAQQRGICCVAADPIAIAAQQGLADISNPWQQRTPRLFSVVYRRAQVLQRAGLPAPYLTKPAFIRKLDEYLRGVGCDAVLCCDQLSTEAMLDLRSRAGNRTPCYALLTEYGVTQERPGGQLDGYFIPHRDLAQKLVHDGIPPERIYPEGVPVARRFGLHRSKARARSTLAIPQEERLYLILADRLRFEEITELCDTLSRTEPNGCAVYVLAGRKSPVRAALERRYQGSEQIRIVTRPRKVELYLQCADVVLLSPDGVESTEAAVAGVPLVHLLAARESERETARFFSCREMSLSCRSVRDAASKAKRLAEQTAEAARMIRRQASDTGANAADRILDRLLRATT